MTDYDDFLHDAPSKRAAEDRRAQRTMMELRASFDSFDPYVTRPVSLEARAKPTTPIQRMVAWFRQKITR